MRIKSLFALPLLAALSASGGAQPQSVIAPLFAADPGTRAALLIENGRVIAKRYAPGFSDANRFISWSDRKSVGEGKSVSVRVDLGGRRIIKKKQQTTHTKQHHLQ